MTIAMKMLLIFYYIIITAILLWNKTPFLHTILAYLTLPALLLFFIRKEITFTPIYYSLIIGIPGTIIIDSIAVISGTWATITEFNSKLFSIITYEQFLWATSFLLFVSTLYEVNFPKKQFSINNKVWELILIIGLLLVPVLYSLLTRNFSLINIPYNFILGGVFLFLIPIVQLYIKDKDSLADIAKLSLITIVIFFLYEAIALKNGVWHFPGDNFLGWFYLFNQKLPYEEFFFFIILGSTGALSYYELYFRKTSKAF